MKFKKVHPWNLSWRQAIELQKKLKKIKLIPLKKQPRLVAGADVTFIGNKAIGAIVIFSLPEFKLNEYVRKVVKVKFPYIPGLLTFREGPVLEKCFRALKNEPEVIIFDGQGLAHPRNMGIATHMGILLDRPTIGCAKTWLYGEYKEPENVRGAFAFLFGPVRRLHASSSKSSNGVDQKGKQIGAVLRTRVNVKPVYVSPGYRIDIESSLKVILLCSKKYRLPEPIRLAHQLAQKVSGGN